MPRHATQTVVRIIGNRVERCKKFFQIANAITIGISNAHNTISLSKINPAITPKDQLHRGIGLLVKDASIFPRRIEHEDLIVLGTDVAFRAKMGVTGDEPDSALRINIDTRWCHEIGIFGQQCHGDAGLLNFNRRSQCRQSLRWLCRIGGFQRHEKEQPDQCIECKNKAPSTKRLRSFMRSKSKRVHGWSNSSIVKKSDNL